MLKVRIISEETLKKLEEIGFIADLNKYTKKVEEVLENEL